MQRVREVQKGCSQREICFFLPFLLSPKKRLSASSPANPNGYPKLGKIKEKRTNGELWAV
jgi:hypothetical protein